MNQRPKTIILAENLPEIKRRVDSLTAKVYLNGITVQHELVATSQNEAYALAHDLSKTPGSQEMIVGLWSPDPWVWNFV